MAFLKLTSPRPDKHVDQSAWNKSWEGDLKQYESLPPDIFGNVGIPTKMRMSIDARFTQTHLSLEKQTRGICVLQQDIRNYALPRLATDDFERKWKGLDLNRRKEVLLEALYKTSCAGPDMEDHRRWCPEMTLPNLSAENGRLFIDMLKKIITDDPTRRRTEPISFSHPAVDQILQHAVFKSIKPSLESNRCYFISLTVWRVLLAFYNDDESYILAKSEPQQSSKDSKKAALALVEQTFGKGEARLLQQELKAFNKKLIEQVNLCWYCGKDGSQLSAGLQLKACAKCKKIGRLIRYCSKDCQTEDWKKGIRRPHKLICGRSLVEIFEEEQSQRISRPGCDSDRKIPEPDPSFKRTPALLHQIALLKHDKNSDYLLMGSGLEPDIGISMVSDIFLRRRFLILRRRALTNGDRIAVDAMCRILQPIALKLKFTTEQLVSQLEKEYGVKVNLGEYMSSNLEPPTKEEEEWAKNLLQSFENMQMN